LFIVALLGVLSDGVIFEGVNDVRFQFIYLVPCLGNSAFVPSPKWVSEDIIGALSETFPEEADEFIPDRAVGALLVRVDEG
jgi:hypothetical protein